jgi:pyruvate dehydrogenase E1 component beta subunit
VTRWEHHDVLEEMQARLDANPDVMRIRPSSAEHPYGTIKAWMGAAHFLTKGLERAKTEMSLHVLAYNFRRLLALVGMASTMQAIRTYARFLRRHAALRDAMQRDERVFLMGQDIGKLGGVVGLTRGLLDEFGPARVRDTAINETFIVGGAAGAALGGTIPVVELQFADFVLTAADEVFHKLAKWRYMHGGQFTLPVVVRLPSGVVGGAGAEHSQSLETLAMHVPGLKVAVPATPADAKGLLKSAIRDPNPVLFFEHKGLYRVKGPVPESADFLVPFGSARVARQGSNLTVVATGLMLGRALEAAEQLTPQGLDLEVIDPRTLVPLDIDTIVGSVEKTHRLMIVHEAPRTAGFGAEIGAQVQERAFFALDAPVWRVCGSDTPLPQDPILEQAAIPSVDEIVSAALALAAI